MEYNKEDSLQCLGKEEEIVNPLINPTVYPNDDMVEDGVVRTHNEDIVSTIKEEKINNPLINLTVHPNDDMVEDGVVVMHSEDIVSVIKENEMDTFEDASPGVREIFSVLNDRYVIGVPVGTFYQKSIGLSKQNMPIFRNDNVSDSLQIGNSLLLAASSKGSLHQSGTTPRQDSYAYGVYENDETKWIILSISDGVSSSPFSHVLAEYLTFSAIKELKLQLKKYEQLKVQEFATTINQLANNFCKKQILKQNTQITADEYTARLGATYFGATLECAVIGITAHSSEVTQFTVSGDGGTYIFKENSTVQVLKTGKERGMEVVSNAITPLPVEIVEEVVSHNEVLNEGDILFITTDGLSDFIGDGNTRLGKFLSNKLSVVRDPIEFLKILNVAMYQLDDDKTAICFKNQGD